MQPIYVVIIATLASTIAFLAYIIIKSFVSPKKVDNIQKQIKAGKYSAAVKTAKSVIERNPRDVMAHYYLGQAYLADGKPELALMELKFVNNNAIFGNGISEPEFRKQIASLYMKFDQKEEALKEYLLLTKLDPRDAENFYNCAKLFEQKGKTDQAFGFYQSTLRLNKRHVKAHAAMGLILYRAKQFAEAKKEIDMAIQLSPDTFSSYYYLGKILKENKDYAAAVAAFEKALRDPEFKQKALIERGSCYMAANNPEKAVLEFDRAVKTATNENSQETLYAMYFLANCYEKMHKIDQALVQWNAIFAKNHNFKDVGAKLHQYKDLQSNDSMKEYLTCNAEAFNKICVKVASTAFGLSAKSVDHKKYGCIMTAVEERKDDWMNMRQQLMLLVFYREPDLIEDSILRKLLEEVKSKNYGKAIVCTSAGFTRTALEFADNRPIELIGKEKLEAILAKTDI